MKFGSRRQASALAATMLVLLALLSFSPANDSLAADAPARRKVIIDQDAFGPAGSNLQAILMLLQAKDVEVLGITIPSGDGWRDEEVSHTLRLLEIAHRTEVPVYPGAVFPLVNTQLRTKRWEELYGQLFYKGAWTEVWPKEARCAAPPITPTRYLVPPSSAGQPTIKAVQENAASFLSRTVHGFPARSPSWPQGLSPTWPSPRGWIRSSPPWQGSSFSWEAVSIPPLPTMPLPQNT